MKYQILFGDNCILFQVGNMIIDPKTILSNGKIILEEEKRELPNHGDLVYRYMSVKNFFFVPDEK
jgi:hypothetical protein